MLSCSRRLTLWLTLFLASSLSAQEMEFIGTLQSLDPQVGTLTISQPPKGQVKTFSLFKKDIPITDSAGNRLQLTDLKKNQRLALSTAIDEDVIAIRQESDLDWGVVISVDVARNELVANLSHSPRLLQITPELRVSIDGKTGPALDIKEVKPWQHGVKVLLSPDRTRIQGMWINKGKYHGNPYCHLVPISGFLIRHDLAAKTMALVTPDRYQLLEFPFDSWTHLQLVHNYNPLRNVPISQLVSPGRVQVGYASDTRGVIVIKLEIATVSRRRVASIDPKTRKLALAASDESPAEDFLIAADAKIVRESRQSGTLADLKENYLVTLGLSPDQKEVIYLSFSEK